MYKRQLLLYFKVTESDYFENLGYNHSFQEGNKINRKKIVKEIQQLKTLHKNPEYDFEPDFSLLLCDSVMDFCHSYLNMVKSCLLYTSRCV